MLVADGLHVATQALLCAPAREYQEVLAKSAILRSALEIAGEGL